MSESMVNARPASRCGRSHRSSFGLLWCMVLAACSAPPAAAPMLQQQPASEEAQIAALKQEEARLLAEVKRELKMLREAGPRDDADRQKLEELERLTEAIETRISQEARNHYWKGRSAEPFQSYGDRLFQRLEFHGIGRPPQRNGKPVYGTAALLFAIRADGTLEEVDVVEASAEEVGQHAVALLRELEPFERFSADMSAQADRIVFARNFRFVRGDQP